MPVDRSSRKKRLFAAALGTLGAILIAEGVCRFDALFPGQDYAASSMRGFLESRAEASNYGDLASSTASTPSSEPPEFRPVPDPWSGWTSPAQLRLVERGTHGFRSGRCANT